MINRFNLEGPGDFDVEDIVDDNVLEAYFAGRNVV